MRQWYAVHTKPRREGVAEENLRRQGYQVYYPRLLQERRRGGRWTRQAEPLFPRYLFVQLERGRDDFAPIRSTTGVADLVRFGTEPRAVPASLIEAIRAREDREQGLHILCRDWLPGDPVEIAEGPFAGLRGIFETENAEERVIVLLRLLGRENRIAVPRDAVVPA